MIASASRPTHSHMTRIPAGRSYITAGLAMSSMSIAVVYGVRLPTISPRCWQFTRIAIFKSTGSTLTFEPQCTRSRRRGRSQATCPHLPYAIASLVPDCLQKRPGCSNTVKQGCGIQIKVMHRTRFEESKNSSRHSERSWWYTARETEDVVGG